MVLSLHNSKMYTENCTLHSSHWTLHRPMHTEHYTLIMARCNLYTEHFIGKTTYCSLHTASYTLHTVHCKLQTVSCTLHTAHCILKTENWTLNTEHCKLYLLRLPSRLLWAHPVPSRGEKERSGSSWFWECRSLGVLVTESVELFQSVSLVVCGC